MTTLLTDTARAALKAALTGVSGLPTPIVNDPTLQGFEESGTPGVKWKLALNDEPIAQIGVVLGEPPVYELAAGHGIVLAIEGEPGEARDEVLRTATEALFGALFPSGEPLKVDGAFEDMRVDESIGRNNIAPQAPGTAPIIELTFGVQLILTAPTPAG